MLTTARGASERRLHEEIDRLTPAYERRLQELVRCPSPIGREGEAQGLVAMWMRHLELEVTSFDIEPAKLAGTPGFNDLPREYQGRPCVVGVRPGRGNGRALIFNAHIDTAPPGDPAFWSDPPCSGVIRERMLFGRGAWDDKAGVIECLLVLEALRNCQIPLAGSLIFKCVIEDEVTGNGTLACLARGHVADGAIIVDGTWPERFIVSHMGQLWFRVTLTGRPAPACVAGRGLNPVRGLGKIVAALTNLPDTKNHELKRAWGAADNPVFINIGEVHAGEWPGSVPHTCTLTGQYGFLPPTTVAEARRDILQAISNAAATDWPLEVPPDVHFWGLETPPLIGDNRNEIVQLVKATSIRLRGKPVIENLVTGHCDLRHYQERGIPACLYGPGGGKNAHIENEYFLLDHMPVVAKNLASAVLTWCR